MICERAKCGKEFAPVVEHQRFCCANCNRRDRQQRSLDRKRAGVTVAPAVPPPKTPPEARPCVICFALFTPKRDPASYCSAACRAKARRGRNGGCDKRRQFRYGQRGNGGEVVRQYGTVVDGVYVPPEGVKVRVWHLTRCQHGEELTRMMKEGKE